MEPLLRVINLSKTFGTLPVIQKVSFEIQPGEIVGLTGTIGSGKSVLVMLLSGLHEPNEGEIYFRNQRICFPFTVQKLGIGVIHQQPTLDDQLDVLSNIFLGNEIGWPSFGPAPLRVLDLPRMCEEGTRILAQLGVQVKSLNEKVSNLTGEQRQMIAIARVLTYQATMIIVDEPTVLLSYPYQQRLLGLIQNWRQQGVSVLFSSNNLDHLFAVTDRIIVLHQGRKVADLPTDEATRETIVSLLLGAENPYKPAHGLTIWDLDSYDRIKEHAEKLRYHQSLLENNLASEDILNRQVIEQLAEQVQLLDNANLALLEMQRRFLTEREQERKHLSRELHDQVIQDLLSINYELEGIESEQAVSPELAATLSNIRHFIRDLVDNLRGICGNLRPPTIDSLGLGAALQSFTRDWSGRTGIKVILDLDTNLRRLPEATELSLFRIVQEGLNNVWRHAQASQVEISLQHTSPRTLMISIRDNGQGLFEDFDLATLAANGHYGLIGISERVTLLGGRFRLQRAPEGGALLMVEIPHARVDSNLGVNS